MCMLWDKALVGMATTRWFFFAASFTEIQLLPVLHTRMLEKLIRCLIENHGYSEVCIPWYL